MKWKNEIKCILKNIPTVPIRELVRVWIEIVYERFDHNKVRTAKALGVSRTKLLSAERDGARLPSRGSGRPIDD